MKIGVLVATAWLAALALALGGGAARATFRPEGPTVAMTRVQLVGRWERLTTCRQFVEALRNVGLGSVAPGVLAGNGLVAGTAKQLAAKREICEGAVARLHSHFFTRTGQFGSLDWNQAQVDDGPYRVVGARTISIGPPLWQGTFRYRIVGGKTLHLTPVLTPAEKRFALAHPLRFSPAGWMVSVALAGGGWKRVPCVGWC